MKKVSFVCTTYRRFRCVERIIEQYLGQNYGSKELIIFNTDGEYPFELDPSLLDENIILINNDRDYLTGLSYTNRGQICRDAVTHATGDYFMLADDDDIYLPWHLLQAVEGIECLGTDAWKPKQSFFATPGRVILVQNTMEASVIVKMDRIREIGFREGLTGYEGLSWYTKLRDEGQLNENNPDYVPSYCFNWSDPSDMAGHKQSGNIDSPSNFNDHKLASNDLPTRKLNRCGLEVIENTWKIYYDFLRENTIHFNIDHYNRYVLKWINR
jgi:hypothetical protein